MNRPLPLAGFALATLIPALMIVWAAFGGPVWLGFLYMTGLAIVLDQVIPYVAGNAAEGAEFPAADGVLILVALAHLGVMPLAVWAIAGPSGLSLWERALLFLGAGLWAGQVTNPAAHELIHRGNRWLYRLGVLLYCTLMFGQHASAHRLVHHVHAASERDPNSARLGESFYQFFPRAWIGAFRLGWRAEAARQRPLHPYVWYGVGTALALGGGYVLAGWTGLLVWMGLAFHAQVQLMLSDYVQHYGLRRALRADGRLEPVGPNHSWNAPHWFSAALMLNAPRHSDHHAHPSRPYPALRLPGAHEAPMLPMPLPLACTVALFPRLWRRMIHPLLGGCE